MEKIMTKIYIKVCGTDTVFTMEGNPTYPDILSFARQNKIQLPDQPIFSTTRPPNPDYWDQYTGDKNDS